jgi:hypothetical protein
LSELQFAALAEEVDAAVVVGEVGAEVPVVIGELEPLFGAMQFRRSNATVPRMDTK